MPKLRVRLDSLHTKPLSCPLMKHQLTMSLLVAILFNGLITAGCGGSSGMAPVSGSVTYKGKPVAKANVSFTPLEGTGRAASAFTNESGRYTLGTLTASDGAAPGKY